MEGEEGEAKILELDRLCVLFDIILHGVYCGYGFFVGCRELSLATTVENS